ncbi:glucose-1-phosphate adenylyltransferase large subunit 3 chloroplastic/amyloplastic [Prunus yedoensis var. nudiflora]|uniref:glucose-1-phosphate adenylyltransferase n=1 Tax=Prunus yedoensis var. nudiflora TaxID=2094558 RepID=A0A314U5X3_PRUYE|nr:glucose-1-phosphate adenylyltransferase large subunit 3 chloroplastic/amyloplastic [Prunus yedoensis var. nudiflora]
MAVSADHCRISLSAPSQLRGAAGFSGRSQRVVKFCNGDLMGKKLNLTQLQLGAADVKKNGGVGQHVCMSLTTEVPVGEAKLRDIDIEKRDPRTVVAIILGGGAGTRLFPLTKRRAKPAVPIGGAYRLIDVPMSNCINSGINKVYILTQFNSASLNRHISRAYNFGSGTSFGDGYVEVLAATQTPERQARSGSRVQQTPCGSSIGFSRYLFQYFVTLVTINIKHIVDIITIWQFLDPAFNGLR